VPDVERDPLRTPAASPNVRQRNEVDNRPSLSWRVALVFLAVVVIWLFVVEGLGPFFGPAYSDRVGHAVRAVAVSALVVPLIVVARRYLDRRPWAGLRLPSLRVGWRPALFGAAFWLVAAGVGLSVTLAFGWARVTADAPSAEILLLALYLPLLVFLYEALPEELIFRGYFYRNLAARYAPWIAVLTQAVLFTLFGATIGAAGSVDRVILFFTFSVVLGILRVVTGNLWTSIGFHLMFQWVTQLYSAAVREGSLRIEAQPTLDLVVFWFFPIVLGSVALVLASASRKRRTRWRDPDPDPPSTAASTPCGP
jgi:membrane protease YdiL (CAAX protease family)